MTIDDISKQLHVSKSTLYARLKERNIEPNALRDDQRQLTSEGMSIIASLFPGKTFSTASEDVCRTFDNHCDSAIFFNKTVQNNTSTDELYVLLRSENTSLKREIELLKEMLQDVKSQRDHAQEENGRLLAALEAAQSMQNRLLPDNIEHGRASWLIRLFGKK